MLYVMIFFSHHKISVTFYHQLWFVMKILFVQSKRVEIFISTSYNIYKEKRKKIKVFWALHIPFVEKLSTFVESPLSKCLWCVNGCAQPSLGSVSVMPKGHPVNWSTATILVSHILITKLACPADFYTQTYTKMSHFPFNTFWYVHVYVVVGNSGFIYIFQPPKFDFSPTLIHIGMSNNITSVINIVFLIWKIREGVVLPWVIPQMTFAFKYERFYNY